jgi:phosphatidylglycerophosphate synthase
LQQTAQQISGVDITRDYNALLRPHNLLTLFRLPLAFFTLLIYDPLDSFLFNLFLCTVALASLTDFLDGKIARRLEMQSEFGYVLDGLCDRAFHVALIMAFFLHQKVPLAIVWLLVLRDIAIYALRLCHVNWFQEAKKLRPLSIIHGYGVRLWIVVFMVADFCRLHMAVDLYKYGLRGILNVFIVIILMFSYWGLWKMLAIAFSDSDQSQQGD